MPEYFSSINPDNNPDNEAPELDAEYWATKAEGLLPGEIVHPRPYSSLAMDSVSKRLYVKAGTEFDNDAYTPRQGYYGERYGLIRIFQQGDDGNMLDGFVADIRPLEKGGVRTERIATMDEDYTGPLAALKPGNYMPVLGYVFTDHEGGTSYKGLDVLKQDAQFLAETVDQLRQPTERLGLGTETQTATANSASEQEALITLKKQLGAEDDGGEPKSHSETPIADAVEAIKKLQGVTDGGAPQAKLERRWRFWPRNR